MGQVIRVSSETVRLVKALPANVDYRASLARALANFGGTLRVRGYLNRAAKPLAESLDIRRLATRDVRHFAAVRLRDGRPFELAVYPTDPDNS